MIEILNLRHVKPTKLYDIYVDRRSPLGNTFHMLAENQRDIVCDKYQEWFDSIINNYSLDYYAIEELKRLQALYKKHHRLRLFCWCAPKRCHAETIKTWLMGNI